MMLGNFVQLILLIERCTNIYIKGYLKTHLQHIKVYGFVTIYLSVWVTSYLSFNMKNKLKRQFQHIPVSHLNPVPHDPIWWWFLHSGFRTSYRPWLAGTSRPRPRGSEIGRDFSTKLCGLVGKPKVFESGFLHPRKLTAGYPTMIGFGKGNSLKKPGTCWYLC